MMKTNSFHRRAEQARAIARAHYEPGNQSRSLKHVWRCYAQPEMGICYRTFLNYIKQAPDTDRPRGRENLGK